MATENKNVYRILTLNFGSTSTKIAIYEDKDRVSDHTILHSKTEMADIKTIQDNANMRLPLVLNYLDQSGYPLESFDAIVGRGGMLRPLPSGTYTVNDQMLRDLRECRFGNHASNLGAIIAAELSQQVGIPAFVVDPPVVDEMSDIARLSGHPDFPRRPVFHALNHKAIARHYAEDIEEPYEALNLIVAHMGGGVTVGAHHKGKVIDVNNTVDGDGPYTAERPGGLPVLQVLRAAFEHRYGSTYEEQRRFYMSQCGLMAYTGTNDGRVIAKRIAEGDQEAEMAFRGMAYQVAKEIGSMSVVLHGKVDAILLTGGLAHDPNLTQWIEKEVRYIAPVHVYPGEYELFALAMGALRVLRGKEQPRVYAE